MRARPFLTPLLLLALAATTAPAQQSADRPAQAASFMSIMHRDVNQVQEKIIGLAKAIPESAYGYKPGGARTTSETFKHVVADNYLIPIAMGKPAPTSSGITDYPSSVAYEKRTMTKEQVIAELEASFKHLHEAMNITTDANLAEQVDFFGSKVSRQHAMIATVTHLHEHLGQLIAYARANNVTPPWSQ